ncbi:transmembrane and ubiquitin-like domain-containing protein 2 isoform X2 [Pseudomyrmex gracilis]|uniref:transmembrane and ubiquitin-like domain-containing protein 2 isoform X2 n=1 Tax=Pseudomyrmex gracilis TaxID=219809 RepID=UPI000995DB56|nr:transmembrane and ubiquitin-like domain-containing protein 2 isoform X2 [Pseudomyrmex gracilis]
MSLIEGVGDEVTEFFIILSILLIGWLAWCSTNISDQPLIRTVLILRDRSPAQLLNDSPAHVMSLMDIHEDTNNTDLSPSLERTEVENTSEMETISDSNDTISPYCIYPTNSNPNTSITESTPTEEILIEAMDSFSNDTPALLPESVKSDISATNTAMQTTCSSSSEPIVDNAALSDNSNEITIKLKFINDDQKLVTGSLKEMLGDFKRRHFQIELEAHKSVRLIFNGRVLKSDTQTLEQCGFFNNCVVHCWVHQPRPAAISSSQTTSTLDSSSTIYFNSQPFPDLPTVAEINSVQNEWDLSRLLVALLTIILGIGWYSRYHYAQLFTVTTTIALYALTVIFAFSLLSNFFPDQDNIGNVE